MQLREKQKKLNKLKEIRTNIMQELKHILKTLCINCLNLPKVFTKGI